MYCPVDLADVGFLPSVVGSNPTVRKKESCLSWNDLKEEGRCVGVWTVRGPM